MNIIQSPLQINHLNTVHLHSCSYATRKYQKLNTYYWTSNECKTTWYEPENKQCSTVLNTELTLNAFKSAMWSLWLSSANFFFTSSASFCLFCRTTKKLRGQGKSRGGGVGNGKIIWQGKHHKFEFAPELTRGITNGSLKPMELAMVSTGSRQENIAPNKMILPIRGCTGRLAR